MVLIRSRLWITRTTGRAAVQEQPAHDPAAFKRKILEVLKLLFIETCHRGPLVLEIEDLRWVDATSDG
jgi:hypothetical protein